jgi:hypothetical protein
MNVCSRFFPILILTVVAGPAPAETPLFDNDSILDLTIEAPMRELIRKRLDRTEYDAVARYTDSSGAERVLHAKLAPRGNARLESCRFPPLRLTFDKRETAGTVFEGQDDLKMVSQCNRSRDGENWLLQELGIYRAYNVVTEYSYRARRLNVTYLDSTSSRWKRTQPSFFIESTGEVADRLELDLIRPPVIEPGQFNQAELAKNVLFQLLIANTDFSTRHGPSGEGCCHNGRVLASPGQQKNWIVVPYDFDQAGIINTDYALPDERLGIRAVNSRLYRGFCWQSDSLPEAIELFQRRREEITQALLPEETSTSRKSRIRRFTDGFYEILSDPKELKKRITDKCRGAATFAIRKTTTS